MAEGAKLAWTEDHGERGKRVVEFVLEAVGGKTRLRLVHSGFGAGASFDDEFDSTNGGWLTFLACLRYYVEEMRGAAGRHVWRMSMPDREPGAVWAKLVKGLGMAGQDWSVGARYTATIPGGGRFSGVVVAAPKRGYAVLRVDELGGSALALFCEACGGGCAFTASWYLYGTGLDPDCALLSDWNRYYDALSVKRGEAG